MNDLILYDRACQALAQAKSTDEVKAIRDEAVAMQAYARIAKNRDLEADASEIRLRAERRVGELMKAQAETVGLAKGAAKKRGVSDTPRLKDAGIDKNLAKQGRKLAAMDDEEFADTVAETRSAVAKAARKVVATRTKKATRAAKEEALASTIMNLPEKRFGVLYADPPWRIEAYSKETGLNKAPDNHYPTLELSQICDIDVPGISARDSVLFLWTTTTMLAQAMKLIEAWGFEYKTHVIWSKIYPGEQTGTGYWFRNRHEILLVATRGKIPAPVPGTQWESVIEAPIGRHSEKPGIFHRLIEEYFPNLPKIEIFARSKRKGWTVVGNEVPKM